MGKDNNEMRRESFMFGGLLRPILDTYGTKQTFLDTMEKKSRTRYHDCTTYSGWGKVGFGILPQMSKPTGHICDSNPCLIQLVIIFNARVVWLMLPCGIDYCISACLVGNLTALVSTVKALCIEVIGFRCLIARQWGIGRVLWPMLYHWH